MFIIIFGARERRVELGRGQFHCPQCDATRAYQRYRAATYFTLFFVPLFRLKNHGEYVECQECGQVYPPEAITRRPPSAIERWLAPTRADLESGTPANMAQQKLVNVGVDDATAKAVVDRALGSRRVTCPTCGLSYHERVLRCSSCGGLLQPDNGSR